MVLAQSFSTYAHFEPHKFDLFVFAVLVTLILLFFTLDLFLFFTQFLKVAFHLQFLPNIGYIPGIVQYILELCYTQWFVPPTPPHLYYPSLHW